ncbi:MAG: methyltransferase family protein [Solirubrobacterales bacterium]
MNVAALVLYLAFLILAFGLRTVIHIRNTGSSGFLGLSGHVGSAEWVGGVLFIVATAVGLLAPVLAVAGIVEPATNFDSIQPLGLGIGVLGLALTLWAQAAMGNSWRIGVDEGERTDLVTSGAFGLVRNPIFSAMIVFSIGLLLAVPTFVSVIAFASLMIALELQTRKVEEPYLLVAHDPEYREYAARVGRFVPGVGRLRP